MLRLLLFFLLYFTYISAHLVKPAYLEIKSIGGYTYLTKWKVPIAYNKHPSIAPLFPKTCQEDLTHTHKDENILFVTSTLHCKETLRGKTISIKNIENEIRTVIFHFEEEDTSYFTEFNPSNPSLHIKNATNHSHNTLNYISSGIEHILIGYDHLLFVLGLLLLIRKWRALFETISAFTLSHSITLGASALGYVVLPEIFIERMIALSIVILAVEIVYLQQGKAGLFSKFPWIVALFFGLIHGFGFSNALSELALPKEHLIQALLFFNMGIEIGQILFILFLISFYYLLKYFLSKVYLSKGKTLLAYFIGISASYWLVERLVT